MNHNDRSKDNLNAFGKMIITELRENPLDHLIAVLRSYHPEKAVKASKSQTDHFLSSLTEEQAPMYLRHITEVIEGVVFNVMRELDEGQIGENELILTFNGEDVTQLPLVGNGNLSGEIFDWIKQFSKYPSPLVN